MCFPLGVRGWTLLAPPSPDSVVGRTYDLKKASESLAVSYTHRDVYKRQSEDSPVITHIETNIFDIEEIYPNCTVQVLRNSVTSEVSVDVYKRQVAEK